MIEQVQQELREQYPDASAFRVRVIEGPVWFRRAKFEQGQELTIPLKGLTDLTAHAFEVLAPAEPELAMAGPPAIRPTGRVEG